MLLHTWRRGRRGKIRKCGHTHKHTPSHTRTHPHQFGLCVFLPKTSPPLADGALTKLERLRTLLCRACVQRRNEVCALCTWNKGRKKAPAIQTARISLLRPRGPRVGNGAAGLFKRDVGGGGGGENFCPYLVPLPFSSPLWPLDSMANLVMAVS